MGLVVVEAETEENQFQDLDSFVQKGSREDWKRDNHFEWMEFAAD